jgi:hypothetical protein
MAEANKHPDNTAVAAAASQQHAENTHFVNGVIVIAAFLDRLVGAAIFVAAKIPSFLEAAWKYTMSLDLTAMPPVVF